MIVAGFGFRAEVGVHSLRAALDLASQGVTPDVLATADGKSQSVALQALAAEMGLKVHPVTPDQLQAQDTTTQSRPSQTAFGTGSVAEAAALAAAGPRAQLITSRQISPDRMASCAIAKGDGQ